MNALNSGKFNTASPTCAQRKPSKQLSKPLLPLPTLPPATPSTVQAIAPPRTQTPRTHPRLQAIQVHLQPMLAQSRINTEALVRERHTEVVEKDGIGLRNRRTDWIGRCPRLLWLAGPGPPPATARSNGAALSHNTAFGPAIRSVHFAQWRYVLRFSQCCSDCRCHPS